MAWSDRAADYLLGSNSCPRCERSPVGQESCPHCGAILTGPIAEELNEVSAQAAQLLRRRQEIIGRLGTKASIAPPPAGRPGPAGAAPGALPAPAIGQPASSSQVSLQSVLAISGAVLVAVAIVVFRFFNFDVDLPVRRLVIAGATIVFLGFAWLLARVKLTFSAEAVGALAMVFVALDIWAISELVPEGVSPWTFSAIATLVASVLTLVIAVLVRMRVWLWLGLVGLVFVPVFFGYAVDGEWSSTAGHLAAVAVAILGFEIARRLGARFESPLLADRVTMTVLSAFFGFIVLCGLLALAWGMDQRSWVLGSSISLATLAALAAAATRTLGARAWSAMLGLIATAAVGVLPFALQLEESAWLLTLVPAATAVGLAALALVPWPATIVRMPVRAGALAVALASTVPSAFVALTQLISPLMFPFGGWFAYAPLSDQTVVVKPSLWWTPMEPWSIYASIPSVAAILGLVAATAGVFAVAFAARREGGTTRPWLILAAWLTAAAIVGTPAWSALSRPAQVLVGVVLVVGLVLALRVIPRVRAAAPSLRTPLLAAAHGILIYVVAISWGDERVTVAGGAAAVAAFGLLALAMPVALRAGYVAVGYAYALVVFARALQLLELELIPVISYTATVASLFALAITLVRRVRAPLWYAVLGVTALPFLIGVATVVAQRTWETALANAAIFALCLAMTLTRRPGLSRWLRSGAAALLLPSLAVVFVNVVPRIIETDIVPAWSGQGGAPVTLPLIATLVAVVLPSATLIAESLRRGDVSADDTATVRLWIEISAFVTGGITALLSLVLETPDLGTALLVFLILGLGAAAAAVFAKRRYGWWLAAACWTAALWCVWGLVGIADVEPYVYPPAIAAVVIGVVLTLRNRDGAVLVATGLGVATATSLVVLAVSGSGTSAALPWRALALLAASLVLLAVGATLVGRWARLAPLRVPVLGAAIGAAAAGAVQAVRYAWERDDLGLGHPDLVVWPVLTFSVAAAILAGESARWVHTRNRWLTVPALGYLIVGPIAAVAPGVAPMWVLWALMVVLLLGMLLTVLRGLRGATKLPPTWVIFLAAWCVGVAGWSVRDLNVEWFSLPLGLALTAAGVLVLRAGAATGGTLTSWPVGFRRTWALLGPGIVVTLLPSVLATGTNPATWRAILVLALALVALLVGALRRYAAPFVLSLVTFAVEILVILVVLALGRDIDPVVFYVAAGSAGLILLIVGIWFERRSRAADGGSARMRDLR